MNGEDFLNSDKCPNIKSAWELDELQFSCIGAILEDYHEAELKEMMPSDDDKTPQQTRGVSMAYSDGWNDFKNKLLNK